MRAQLAILEGDGIGPEVIRGARRLLEVVAESGGHHFDFEPAQLGGRAIDETGSPLPPETLEICQRSDAILLGAIGGPKWSDPAAEVRPEQGLLDLRRHLGLFANLRPVKISPALRDTTPLRPELLEGVDLLIVRELAGGLYFGPRREYGDDPHRPAAAWDTLVYEEAEIERVARLAFTAARSRRRRLASIDKANVLASMRLWRRVVDRVAVDFPDVEVEHVLVDAAAMHLMRRPASFDVILAGNLFGDILSDEASVLAGSLGMLPSASLSEDGPGLYEPVHGSAPDIAGQGIANPLGAILSAAMLLCHSLSLEREAEKVERAVGNALAAGWRTADQLTPADVGLRSAGTDAMSEAVIDHFRRLS